MTVDNCQTPSVPEPQRDGGARSVTERAAERNTVRLHDKSYGVDSVNRAVGDKPPPYTYPDRARAAARRWQPQADGEGCGT